MTWTAPKTWTANTTLTAAELNEQIRDNLLRTAPALAKGTRGYFASTGQNEIAARATVRAGAVSSVSTNSTSYTDLDGPFVELVTDAQCLVMFAAWIERKGINDSSVFMSVRCSGATTISANDDWAIRKQSDADMRISAANFRYFSNLNPGTNRFTCQYKTGNSTGTGAFWRRRIVAMPL